MPSRTLSIDGADWQVSPSGFVTQYDGDEFALVFARGSGEAREVRVTRFSPTGTRSRDQALAEMDDPELRVLFGTSQASDTSPEAGYAK